MCPRIFSARIVLIFCVVVVPVLSLHFGNHAVATQSGVFGYCASEPDQSKAFVSEVFNTGLSIGVTNDTRPMQNEFGEYLKGRFDFKSNSSFSVNCPIFESVGSAQSGKAVYETQMRQGNKQLIEVQWNYRPDPGARVSGPQPQHSLRPTTTAQADHTFCISDSYQNTVYYTGPVSTPSGVSMALWVNGFTQFLNGKYSFQGRVYCNMGTVDTARRLVNAHLDGSRAGGRTVVDTGWKYDATQTTSTAPSRPAVQDEDREPAQRPAPQPPNLQARDFAIKEHPRALAYCVADRAMAGAFDCECLVRQISQYRLNHVSDTLSASPTPLEELYKGDRFDCKSCIQVDWKFKPGILSVARIPRTREGQADCIVNKMRALVEAKPYPSQTRELLNEAMTACK